MALRLTAVLALGAACVAFAPACAGATDASPVAEMAHQVLAEQWQAVGNSGLTRFELADDADAGLFAPERNGTVAVPVALLRDAQSVGEVRALLALRKAYLGQSESQRSPNGVAQAALELAGSVVEDVVRGQDRANPDRPLPYRFPSELDNAPVGMASRRDVSLRVSSALASGGCELDAINLLKRLSSANGASGPSPVIQREARAVLRDLGMFAFNPSPACARFDDAAFTRLKALLAR